MAQFCPKCGQEIKENEKFCGVCGAPLNDEEGGKKSKKWLLRGGILIGLIVILALIVSTVQRSTGYKGTIQKMAKAYKNADVETLVELTSAVEVDILGEDAVSKYWEDVITRKLDEYEDKVDEVKKINVEVSQIKEFSDRRLEDAMEYVEDTFNVDTSDVKKAICVDLRVKIQGKKKKITDRMNDIYLLKEKGGWKIYLGEGFN